MKSTNHFAWIDFLRGLAAVGIVLYHVRVDLWVGWVEISTHPESFSIFDRAAALLSIPLPFLRSAVMLFFLVSGFCVHYPYAASGRLFELKPYSIRRFLRIYPPYLAVVALGILIEWFRSHYFGEQITSASKILATVLMIQNYGSEPGQMGVNPSLWSLPVELELYLVYPFFYWLLMRNGIKRSMVVVGLVSLGALGLFLSTNLHTLYNNLNYIGNFAIYWIIWCAGALLAEWVKRDRLPRWQPWLWIVMALTFSIAMVSYFLKLFIGIQELVWAGFYFLVILWGLTQKDPLKFLSSRMRKLFLSIGLISYSLYLIHFPFFKLCGIVWLNIFGTKPANFLIPLFFCIVCIPLAYAFYLYIEAPSHRLARKLAGSGNPPRIQSS
jgi:peptidoglycan/LPS O-acetylase OafA/YrhL